MDKASGSEGYQIIFSREEKMLQKLFLFSLFISLVFSGCDKPMHFDQYSFSGPHTCKNLSIYLIHGPDTYDGTKFMTLQEAMKKGKVKVHETGNVNQLEITSLSPDHDIYIMSGDIVKGGRQDRAIQYNYILPPKTKHMKVASFCVERGRWEERQGESVRRFNSSEKMVATKDLKLSLKKRRSQQKVWEDVSKAQHKLGASLGNNVRSARSATSFQLTLEHKNIKKAQKEYRKALKNILKGKKNVIGYAIAINGKINSGEIFASHLLFQKLWPKLFESSVVEAVAEYNKKTSFTIPKTAAVKNFFIEAEKARTKAVQDYSADLDVKEKESKDNVLFETRSKKMGKKWINKSYYKK